MHIFLEQVPSRRLIGKSEEFSQHFFHRQGRVRKTHSLLKLQSEHLSKDCQSQEGSFRALQKLLCV